LEEPNPRPGPGTLQVGQMGQAHNWCPILLWLMPPPAFAGADRHVGHGAPASAATAAAKLSRSSSSWSCRLSQSMWPLWALSSRRQPGETCQRQWSRASCPAAEPPVPREARSSITRSRETDLRATVLLPELQLLQQSSRKRDHHGERYPGLESISCAGGGV